MERAGSAASAGDAARRLSPVHVVFTDASRVSYLVDSPEEGSPAAPAGCSRVPDREDMDATVVQ